MSKFLDILKQTKIDLSQTIVSSQGGTGGIDYFDIKPKDFIRYAKEDFKQETKKGLVNSITNAKRAIDCQIDTVLKYFGIDFDKIPRESEELINKTELLKSDLPHKLKLIQALKFAPSGLTSKARNLRNKLEHYYQIPSENEIREAIEISELFIMSCESKTKMVDDDFIISSTNFIYKDSHSPSLPDYMVDRFSNQIRIDFDYQNKRIRVEPTIDKMIKKKIYFLQTDPEYYFLLRLINSIDDEIDFIDSLKIFINYIKHPIPIDNIKFIDWY
jgi:uncharacterized protein YoxC